MKDLKARIVAQARKLGFDPVGVTDCRPPVSYPRYQTWIARGYHGQMTWLATPRNLHRRADPHHILPECGSILVLGVPYHPPPQDPVPPTQGCIAAYAQHPDYHKALREPLRALTAFIQQIADLPQEPRPLYYTDTGAILERDLAQRAGLGWVGKNGMLINPARGSYFLLAEILLPLSLPPDPPFPADRCGSCTRCLDLCPTQAILPGERTIDARRCISYLTIELRQDIPTALRPGVGNWIFGCDLCQQVCPWNRFARPPETELLPPPRRGAASPDLIAEWQRYPDEAAFSRAFAGSAIRRSKLRGYRRNLLVALGNSGNPAARPLLAEAAQDEDPLIREHARWALQQLERGGESR